MYFYEIRILNTSCIQIDQIDRILGVKSSYRTGMWRYELTGLPDDCQDLVIDQFLALINGKYNQLESIGISRDSITFWLLFEYDQECNLEFNPKELEKIGKEGIALCVSCWKK